MDVEEIFHVDFADRLKSIRRTGFDADLASKAEELSGKWIVRFQCSSPDEDIEHVTRFIKSTGISVGQVNTFTQQNLYRDLSSNQGSLQENDKLVLLDNKYFGFEGGQSVAEIEDNPILHSTISDQPDISHEANVDGEKSTKKRSKNRYKNKAKKNQEIASFIASTTMNSHGAPPGVTISKSMTRCNIDLTKTTNSSMHFRL